jgi:hypothetical protein
MTQPVARERNYTIHNDLGVVRLGYFCDPGPIARITVAKVLAKLN